MNEFWNADYWNHCSGVVRWNKWGLRLTTLLDLFIGGKGIILKCLKLHWRLLQINEPQYFWKMLLRPWYVHASQECSIARLFGHASLGKNWNSLKHITFYLNLFFFKKKGIFSTILFICNSLNAWNKNQTIITFFKQVVTHTIMHWHWASW